MRIKSLMPIFAYVAIAVLTGLVIGALYYVAKWIGFKEEHIPVVLVVIIFVLLGKILNLQEKIKKLKKT